MTFNFDACSFYKALCGTGGIPFLEIVFFFFFWVKTSAWGKILIIDNLINKDFSLMGWCDLCRCNCDFIYVCSM